MADPATTAALTTFFACRPSLSLCLCAALNNLRETHKKKKIHSSLVESRSSGEKKIASRLSCSRPCALIRCHGSKNVSLWSLVAAISCSGFLGFVVLKACVFCLAYFLVVFLFVLFRLCLFHFFLLSPVVGRMTKFTVTFRAR